MLASVENMENTNGANKHDQGPVSLQQRLAEFAEITSLQGPVWIVQAKSMYIRLFWIFVFLAGWAATIYQLVSVFQNYYARNTVSKVTLKFRPIPFPSITVCNINPILKSKLVPGEVDPWFLEQVTELMSAMEPARSLNYPGMPRNESISDVTGVDQPVKRHVTDEVGNRKERRKRQSAGTTTTEPPDDLDYGDYIQDMDFMMDYYFYDSDNDTEEEEAEGGDEFRAWSTPPSESAQRMKKFYNLYSYLTRPEKVEIGHQAEIMILHCTMDGMICSPSDFTLEHVSRHYGNCYTFNSAGMFDRPFSVGQSGPKHGLSLTLFLQSYEYMSGLDKGVGAKVTIHPFNSMPFLLERSMSVAPGTHLSLGLQMKNVTRLGPPYGICDTDARFKKYFNRTYTLEACLNTCVLTKTLEKCNCYLLDDQDQLPLYSLEKYKPCRNSTKVNTCIKKLKRDVIKCNQLCHQACRETIYEVVSSEHVWPDARNYYDLINAVCERDLDSCDRLQAVEDQYEQTDILRQIMLRNNFLKLDIYFRNLIYEEIAQVAEYEYSQFLSDIGGSMGLWLGATVFTGVEILSLILSLFGYCAENSGTLKKKNDRSDDYKMNAKNTIAHV